MPQLTTKFKYKNYIRRLRSPGTLGILSVAAVAVLGVVILAVSGAAAPFYVFEPESGSVTSPATVISDATASAAKAVKFGATGTASCLSGAGVVANAPGTADPWGGCWPGPNNTGPPVGKTLRQVARGESIPGLEWNVAWDSWFTGQCGAVIDGVELTGDIFMRYGNTTRSPNTPCITIKNSRINGNVDLDAACLNAQAGNAANHCGPLVMMDTEVNSDALSPKAMVIYDDFYIYRMNLRGTPLCNGNCVVQDSWVHDLWAERGFHMDAISSNGNGAGNALTMTHNWFDCGKFRGPVDPEPGLGCSTVIGSHPDFDSITMKTTYNYIAPAVKGWAGDMNYQPPYCLNPGIGTTKPYPTINDYIAYNVFARGFTGHCGIFGAVYAWGNGDVHQYGTDSGNVWGPGNQWDDGTPMPNANDNSINNCSGQGCLAN